MPHYKVYLRDDTENMLFSLADDVVPQIGDLIERIVDRNATEMEVVNLQLRKHAVVYTHTTYRVLGRVLPIRFYSAGGNPRSDSWQLVVEQVGFREEYP